MSAVDEVFACYTRPWSIMLDLPLPPSINRFSFKLGNRSPVVARWVHQADMYFVLQTAKAKPQMISGYYEMHITWTENSADIDNRIKALHDFLQRLELIENDRLCRQMLVDFGHAPEGCRVRLRPWVAA